MVDYSGKSLATKLGIKPEFNICVQHSPESYRELLKPLPNDLVLQTKLTTTFDLIHAFYTSFTQFEQEFAQLKDHLKPNGALWISWPKKSAKQASDLDENVIREIALQNGLVDVKVIAVDEMWSGLKLVYRLKDRPKSL